MGVEAAWPVGARVNTNWVFSGAKEARWEEVEEVEEVEDCEEGEDLAGCTSIRGTWGGTLRGNTRIGGLEVSVGKDQGFSARW